ncbi:cupin-like domain-containing protein [Porphyrobacter algicida]|uniref:Cupin-like domain-containing protein n=1 Tax=Qipengyuania algicida TaxID=1836209 RepID=A0A845AHC7_9SPHN|nr:cupin-like domain-containing protein [Qipengyuania algicida]MXP28225.1 cupin-like domain-containing protein [Qipengyuania algicida]
MQKRFCPANEAPEPEIVTPVEEISAPSPEVFERDHRSRYRPLVIRDLASDWPIVASARNGTGDVLRSVEAMDSGVAADLMVAPPDAHGRFFYSSDMRGFNFRRERVTLSQLTGHLRQIADQPSPLAIYAGAVEAQSSLPGFTATHPLPLAEAAQATCRIWLGNASQVATHFDLSDNFAVVVLGSRRFTLFPPECVGDLYVGPLDRTLAGQPVSMVDPLAPDLARYPRYERALAHAQFAELEPGDAIYIPTLWWHHVQARAPINMLVNYWHNDALHGGGFLALVHAILSIRDAPEPQRQAWQAWFEHMVFSTDASESAAHLPDHARGVTGPPSPARDEMMRRFIAQVLMGR